MEGTAFIVLRQVIIMFILVAIGWLLVKYKKITLEGGKTIGNILIYCSLPCVIINSFLVERTPERLQGLGMSFAAALLCMAVCIGLSGAVFQKDPIANFAASFSNPGFFGLPIILASLAEGSSFFIAPYIFFVNIGQWTYGVSVMTGKRGKLSPKTLFTAPFFVAILIGLFFFLTGVPVHPVLRSVVASLANVNTALAMFSIGIYLSQADVKKMLGKAILYRVMAFRQIVIPVICLAILTVLPAEPLELKLAVLIAVSCPVGSNVAVYAQLHKCDYAYAVETVLVSTVTSIITLPVIVCAAEMLWR